MGINFERNSLKALVISYGSIGRRHAEVLGAMDDLKKIVILSSQSSLPFETITSMDNILNFNPDYIVIASPTSRHYEQLKFLENNFKDKKILVEKPLFEKHHELGILKNKVFVGYNIRFNPVVQKIKKTIADRSLWNLHVFCGSYLPDWRPSQNYRETSSAKKDSGGGVLLDLSHELDYLQWMTGPIQIDHAVSEKVSDLDIETDDLLLLYGMSGSGAHVHISLNYFIRKPIRLVLIDGEGISIRGDLIADTLAMVVDGVESNYSWPGLERNDTYRAQHKAVLDNDQYHLCTYGEGIETMSLIDKIRTISNQ